MTGDKIFSLVCLKFYGIGSCICRSIDELFCKICIPIMIDTRLSNDEAWIFSPDFSVFYRNGDHRIREHSMYMILYCG